MYLCIIGNKICANAVTVISSMKKFVDKIFANKSRWQNWQNFLLAKISGYVVSYMAN